LSGPSHGSRRGRFAPSPSGPLHFGSLVAALGSWLDARAHGGDWLVRIEDLDTPRNEPGAEAAILRSLENHGLWWDGAVVRQSERLDLYRGTLADLETRGLAYPCSCSRRDYATALLGPDGAAIYPGTCRNGVNPGRPARTRRLKVSGCIAFDDAIQGAIVQELEREVGDFVLLRADGVFAYQLAVVVDDGAQGIGDVVRGADLLFSTPRQILLQRMLGLPMPRYAHLPLVLAASGEKLSKQTRAPALVDAEAVESLHDALVFLGQGPPARTEFERAEELLEWARQHWHIEAVARAGLGVGYGATGRREGE